MVNLIINLIRYYTVYRWILFFCNKKGEFLDFGCGKGEFVFYLCQKGWHGYGIDPKVQTAATGLSADKELFFSSLADLRENNKLSFNIIILNFSLEHCQDPAAILKELYTLLALGGLIFIRVPNLDHITRNKKNSSFQMKIPEHLHNFTPESLEHLLKQCGFSILRVDTRFCVTAALTIPCGIFPGLDPMAWLYERRIAVKLGKGLALAALCFIFFPYELLKSQIGQGAIIHAVAQRNN
jgi:SAM-dependent methyltransferase